MRRREEEEEGEGRRGGGGLPFGRWWGVSDLDSMKSIIVPPLPPERDTLSTQGLFCETLETRNPHLILRMHQINLN